jgi:hypothetical protein
MEPEFTAPSAPEFMPAWLEDMAPDWSDAPELVIEPED